MLHAVLWQTLEKLKQCTYMQIITRKSKRMLSVVHRDAQDRTTVSGAHGLLGENLGESDSDPEVENTYSFPGRAEGSTAPVPSRQSFRGWGIFQATDKMKAGLR